MSDIQLTLPLGYDTRALMRCSAPRPTNPLHHLSRDAKGWRLALTVQAADKSGRIVRSKRLRWRLSRVTEKEAILIRDTLIAGYAKVGLRVEERQLVRGCRIDG